MVKTAERLHLHRNAVTNRLRTITGLLDPGRVRLAGVELGRHPRSAR